MNVDLRKNSYRRYGLRYDLAPFGDKKIRGALWHINKVGEYPNLLFDWEGEQLMNNFIISHGILSIEELPCLESDELSEEIIKYKLQRERIRSIESQWDF